MIENPDAYFRELLDHLDNGRSRDFERGMIRLWCHLRQGGVAPRVTDLGVSRFTDQGKLRTIRRSMILAKMGRLAVVAVDAKVCDRFEFHRYDVAGLEVLERYPLGSF